MDSERFDAITRMLALGLSRRSATFGLAALTGLGITQFDDAEAKKKRKKKKKNKEEDAPSPATANVQGACPDVFQRLLRRSGL